MKQTCVNLATVTNFIQPETVQKVLVSVNVKSRMPHQTAIDVVTGIMDIRIVSLVTVSWMGLEEDNVKIMVDNVPANRILAENYVMNALMVSTTSQSANHVTATVSAQEIRYVIKKLDSVRVKAILETFHVINVTTDTLDFHHAHIVIVI